MENIEKAQLLMQAADYTRQLQVGCQHPKLVLLLWAFWYFIAWLMSGWMLRLRLIRTTISETGAKCMHECRQP